MRPANSKRLRSVISCPRFPPFCSSSLVYPISSFVPPFSQSPLAFLLFATPDEGMAERRRRPGACEAPVSACRTRDQRALVTGMRAWCFPRPAFPANRKRHASRRSTVAILRPGPVLAVVRHSLRDRTSTFFDARVIVTRRTRSRGPPSGVSTCANLTSGQPQASLRLSRRLRKTPLTSQAERTNREHMFKCQDQ
jgi:hypothetical protein